MNKTNQPSSNPQELGTWAPLLVALSIAILVAVAYWFWFYNHLHKPFSSGADAWGQFGDYFGGLLNPVIAACTLFVAVRVWQLQKKELKDTQEALKEQAETAKQQRSEQRFFDVLNLYLRTLDQMVYHDKSGRSAIAQWVETHLCNKPIEALPLSRFFNAGQPDVDSRRTSRPNKEELEAAWNKVCGFLSHYFRTIFRLLTDAEHIFKDSDECRRYMKLFRAQLNDNELILMGFNLWLGESGRNMLPIAEKYGLLKHLPGSPLRTALEKEMPKVFGASFAARKGGIGLLPVSQTPC